MHQNPEIYIVTIIGIILGLLLVGFIVTILFLYQRRQQQQEKALVLLKDKYEKEALRSQLEIQENTFKMIGQELHDNIGQLLSVVKLTLSALPIEKDHKAAEMIRNSQDVLNKAIIDLSNLTKSLHTERITDIGLAEAIKFELNAIQKTGIINTSFQQTGDEIFFDEHRSIFLFRIFQELLNNIMKHAKATELKVVLSYCSELFTLEMTDNGTGFDLARVQQTTSRRSGIGIRSLFNRASIIGADLNFDTQPGKGTKVLIKLSLPKD